MNCVRVAPRSSATFEQTNNPRRSNNSFVCLHVRSARSVIKMQNAQWKLFLMTLYHIFTTNVGQMETSGAVYQRVGRCSVFDSPFTPAP
jgi:hypothetical protein